MSVRPRTKIKSEFVVPELPEEPSNTELSDLNSSGTTTLPPVLRQGSQIDSNISDGEEGGSSWIDFTINVDLSKIESLAEAAEKPLKALDKIIKVVTVVLKIMRLFSNDLKSLSKLIKVVVKQVIKGLKEFIESLLGTGLYVLPIIPQMDPKKPKFELPINGGFSEYKSVFISSCLNSKDPTAPPFVAQDSVGAFVIATGFSTNDPGAVADMIKNLGVLSRFFGFSNPMPPPPVNVAANSGYFRNETREKKLGVEISWEQPSGVLGVTGYYIYRCKAAKGLKKVVEVNGKKVIRFAFSDEDFNGGEPVEVDSLLVKNKYKYVDFDVESGTKYHYQLFSKAGFDFSDKFEFLQAVESPLGSNRVSATPRSCIPLSELKKYLVEDVDGNPVDTDDLAQEWINLTLGDLLPLEFNSIFRLLNNFADRLSGSLSSAGSALDKYIDFLSKKVSKLLEVVQKIKEIIQRILSYKLSGTVLLLNLEPEEGGMQGLVERFSNAELDNDTISQEEGLYAGVAIVYGFPVLGNGDLDQRFIPEEQAEEYKEKIKKFQEAFGIYKSILLSSTE